MPKKSKPARKRIGILTGGGDAPGLNSVIEAVCKTLLQAGYELVGISDGFEGVFEGRSRPILLQELEGIHGQAGTFLGTSNRCGTEGREKEFLRNYRSLKLQGLIVAGGDGTFANFKKLREEIPLLGVPKTIDNDLSGTEVTFGYDTACSVVANAVDALRFTASAHRRVIVVETMGRTAGWIALGGGLAGYADAILIPERPYDRKKLASFILERKKSGRRGLLIVAAEGARAKNTEAQVAFRVKNSPQEERYGGIAEKLARWIEKETAWESRHVVLGHLQRSTPPTTTDRFLTLSMGVEAARMVLEGDWGKAVVYRSGKVERAWVSELMGPARLVSSDHRWVALAHSLGMFI